MPKQDEIAQFSFTVTVKGKLSEAGEAFDADLLEMSNEELEQFVVNGLRAELLGGMSEDDCKHLISVTAKVDSREPVTDEEL